MPAGWRPGDWSSTRIRRVSSASMTALTSWVQRPPLSRQAADQAQQSGHQTGSGKAAQRDEVPARDQHRSGAATAQTPLFGAGRPTTGEWCAARRSARWTTTCGNSLISGRPSATRTSRNTGVIARYFDMFNKSRRDRWVFGDRDSGAYLRKVAWTRIVRHQMVKGAAHQTTLPWPTTGSSDGARYRPPADQHDQPAALRGAGRSMSALRRLAP